ncbi:cysteine proteinase inhibitor [Striga asiatica]|uniref:Cysteine proteinase inhibitor n=1 Tax=Striga asiatica TaxID=4170 RepID=A0A5A7RGH9_STRAF|nr:cysteine proteinase inhibitor [Striga asiatica]
MEQYNSPDEKPWVPILKPRKSGVVAYGKFAVDEYNKSSHSSLEYKSVLQGPSEKLAGESTRGLTSIPQMGSTSIPQMGSTGQICTAGEVPTVTKSSSPLTN